MKHEKYNNPSRPAAMTVTTCAWWTLLGGMLMLFAAGCGGSGDQLKRFDRLYINGEWDAALNYVQGISEPHDPPAGDDLLWVLQRAAVERQRKNYQASNQWFDRAEIILKHFDFDSGVLDGIGSTLMNETVLPYRGATYDGIMVNTYKALNFMALGQDEDARIEFNRAQERQRRARERFSAEIAKQKAQSDKKKTNKSVDYDKTLNSDATQDKIRAQYSSLYEFEAYPDFVNPFASYLAGVFFAMTDDPAKAIDLLKESAGMVGENNTIMEDFAATDRWLGEGRRMPPSVWVIYENGAGPIKEEFRVDLPLFLVSKDVYYAGIALPKLVMRSRASSSLQVKIADGWQTSEVVAQMDRVMQTEFSKVFPGILTRSLISAAAKVVMQETLTDSGRMEGQLLGFAAAIYSRATTSADLRLWTSLPKEFQVARVPMPAESSVHIRFGSQGTVDVPLDPCRYALIYVKKVAAGTPPVIEVITRGVPVAEKNGP